MVKYYPRKRTNFKKTTNKPVARAITKYKRFNNKKPTVQKVANNRNAIMTLSRQVKSLQMSRLGMFQKRAEQLTWIKNNDNANYPWNTQKPLCFCLNQFNGRDSTTGANVRAPMFYTSSTGNGALFKRFQTWVPSPLVGNSRNLNSHIGDIDDVVSPEAYKPLGTSVKFEFEFNNYPANQRDSHIRIDIIKPKKFLLDSVYHDLSMPDGLGQFCNLVELYMLNRNFINTTYWDIVQTKWIKISNNSGVDKGVTGLATINRSYKNSPIIKTDLNSTSAGTGGATTYPMFHHAVDPRQLEWCVISTGFQIPERMSILRQISWRDQGGTSA